MTDYAAEKAAAAQRREERKDRELYPRMLLMTAADTASEEQLNVQAEEAWPSMDPTRRRRIVDRALEVRDDRTGQRRINPATVAELTHPSEREKQTMAASRMAKKPSKEEVGAFVHSQVDAEPDVDNQELHRRACKHFGTDISRARTSAFARQARDVVSTSTNGNGSAPAPKSVEPERPRSAAKEQGPRGPNTPQAPSRPRLGVQVSQDLDGSAHLYVDIRGLDSATAHRAAAALHGALAGVAAG